MNDLNKKGETDFEGNELSGNTLHASEVVFYKKLGAYLLLLYQLYLKKETRLEAEIKAVLLRMVQFNQDYALKIRMMQLDYLNKEFPRIDGEWDEASDVLFPLEELEILEPISDTLEKKVKEYKEAVLELLNSSL